MNYVTDIIIIIAVIISAVGVFYLIKKPKTKNNNSFHDVTDEIPIDGFDHNDHHSQED